MADDWRRAKASWAKGRGLAACRAWAEEDRLVRLYKAQQYDQAFAGQKEGAEEKKEKVVKEGAVTFTPANGGAVKFEEA